MGANPEKLPPHIGTGSESRLEIVLAENEDGHEVVHSY